MLDDKKIYNFKMLNVMKLVCAILVVMIHTMFFFSISEDLWIGTSLGICRVAVPFFFILSGYFYYNLKDDISRNKQIKKYGMIFLKLVGVEALILSPMVIAVVLQGNVFFLIKSILLIGITGSLWYISSMVIGLIFINEFLKKNKYLSLIVLSGLFFAFGLMGDSYAGIFAGTIVEDMTFLYKNIFMMMQVGITCSVPFLTIGILINRLNLIEKVKKVNLLLSLGIIILLIEAFILYKTGIAVDYNMYVSLLFVGPLLFIWTMRSNFKVSDKTSELCKKYSLLVYVLHQPLMLGMGMLRPEFMSNSILKFLITLTLSFIVATIIIKIQDKLRERKRLKVVK